MNGHTPGPWEVKTPPADPNAYDVYAGGTLITRGYWAHNGKADARLIAAAPDLLSTAKILLGILTDLPAGRNYAEPIQAARAAIAKAGV